MKREREEQPLQGIESNIEPSEKIHVTGVNDDSLSDSSYYDEEDYSDTIIAVQLLNRRFDLVARQVCTIPTILLHQLYTEVDNPATVNQEIHSLRKNGKVRVLRILSGVDEMAVTFEKDYVAQAQKCAENSSDEQLKSAINVFISKVLPNFHDLFITHEDLASQLRTLQVCEGGSDTVAQQKELQDVIGQLVSTGLLVRKMDTNELDAYWFGLPGLGRLVDQVKTARVSLLRVLRRTQYKELPKSQLESRKSMSPTCILPMSFVLADAIGKKLVLAVDTHEGKGKLIRMKKP